MGVEKNKWSSPQFIKDIPKKPSIPKNFATLDSAKKSEVFSKMTEWEKKYDNARYFSEREFKKRFNDVVEPLKGYDNQFCEITCKDKKAMYQLKDAIVDLYCKELTYPYLEKDHFNFGIEWGSYSLHNCAYKKDDYGKYYRIICVSRDWNVMQPLMGALTVIKYLTKDNFIKGVVWSD